MIAFTGRDLLLQRTVADDQLTAALASVLGLSSMRIVVIRNLEDYPERERSDLVALVGPASGDVEELVQLQAASIDLDVESELDVVRGLARLLALECLTPHDGGNPYLMWRISADGRTDLVALRVVPFEIGRYEIERVVTQ